MMQIAPPRLPPPVDLADDGSLDRLRFRLWQLMLTTFTVLATVWCCTFGWVSALAALMVAKHVLVAVFVMGMDFQAVQSSQNRALD